MQYYVAAEALYQPLSAIDPKTVVTMKMRRVNWDHIHNKYGQNDMDNWKKSREAVPLCYALSGQPMN